MVYNEDIGTYGAWDATKCTTVLTEQGTTVCECGTFGTFALVSELVESPYLDEEYEWLTIVKYMGYTISLLFLLTFIVIMVITP